MGLPPSASFLLLYNSALQDYTTQTGTNLIDHPFAKQLEKCESVDSISSLLQQNVQRFREFRGEDGKITKSLTCAVHVLHTLSTSTVLGDGVGLVRSKPTIPISYSPCIFHSHSHPQRPCLLHLQSYSRYVSSCNTFPGIHVTFKCIRWQIMLVRAMVLSSSCSGPSRDSSADLTFTQGSHLRQPSLTLS